MGGYIAAIILLFTSCKSSTPASRYDQILENPPFVILTDSLEQFPDDDALYFRRAVLLNSNDLPEPALDDFRKAWSLVKDERYAYGISNLLLEKNADSALVFLKDALLELPASYLLQLTLAKAYYAKNKYDEALDISNEMLKKNPEQVDLLKLKADMLDKKGNIVEAINTLSAAYRISPEDVELNYMLALKLAENKNARVLILADSLIKADSLGIHAEPYYYKGLYYANINDNAKALQLFDNAVKVDHNFLEGYIEKGSLLFEMKKFAQALEVFKLSLTVSPKFADNYYWIAKCEQAMGDKASAKLNYQRAFNLDNNLIEAKQAADSIR